MTLLKGGMQSLLGISNVFKFYLAEGKSRKVGKNG